MAEVVIENLEEEVDDAEEDTSNEVVEGAAAHMKMELTYDMPSITLNIQSGPHYQTI